MEGSSTEGRNKNGTFKKGSRPAGRAAGVPNKVSAENKNRINRFFEAHWEEFETKIWSELTPKEKKDTFVALLNYAYPKLTSVDVRSQNRVESSVLELLKEKINECSII